MSKKSRSKTLSVRLPRVYRRDLRRLQTGSCRGQISAALRQCVKDSFGAGMGYQDMGIAPDPQVRPIYLQLEPDLRAKLAALARENDCTVEYIAVQYAVRGATA